MLETLTRDLLTFRDERNWAQFHSLRNLIVSLNLEAAELLELTQWKSDAEVESLTIDPTSRQSVADECADVLMYLILVAHAAGIDLETATREKLAKNALKYPVDQAFGSREKYTALQQKARRGD